MRKSALLYFSGFNIEQFFRNESREKWEAIEFRTLRHYSFFSILQVFFAPRRKFFIGAHAFKDLQWQRAFEAVLFFSLSFKKAWIFNEGSSRSIALWHSLWALVVLCIEGAVAAVIVLLMHIVFFLLRVVAPSLKKIRIKKRGRRISRILFLRTDTWQSETIGGSFSHAEGFQQGLHALGYPVIFVGHKLPVSKLGSEDIFFKLPQRRFEDFPEIPDFFANMHIAFRCFAIQKLRPPFMYHRNTFGSCAGAIAALLTGIPLLYEFNGSEAWAREFWGGRIFFKWLAYACEDISMKVAERIFVVSDVLKEELLAKGISKDIIIVNPNGVDPERFSPHIDGSSVREAYGLHDSMVVGFIGTWGAWHGGDILVRSIPLVISQYPRARFLLMGDGQMKSEAERIVAINGVSRYAIFTGAVPHEEVPKHLAVCDILVNPTVPNSDGSRFFGSPTKLFEYMAMGKAIVASDLEQIGEVLENEKAALLVKPGDTKELAGAIVRLVQDGDLRKRLGEAAREEVIKKYTWQMNARRVLEAFENFTKK